MNPEQQPAPGHPFGRVPERNTADNMLRTAQQHHVQLSVMADIKANIIITVSSIVMTLTLGRLNDLHGAAEIFDRVSVVHADTIAAIGQHHGARHTQLLQQADAQLKQMRRQMRKLSSDSRKIRT